MRVRFAIPRCLWTAMTAGFVVWLLTHPAGSPGIVFPILMMLFVTTSSKEIHVLEQARALDKAKPMPDCDLAEPL